MADESDISIKTPFSAAAADPAKRRYRVTSFDVAAEAGVSQSTVSRALAGDPVVSEATRARVAAAAAKLNYHVDENAARLRTGKTGTLAVVVVCRPDEEFKSFNPFHYALLGSVCAAASRRRHETLVSFQGAPDRLWGLYQEQRKADGLIVIGTSENRPAWDYFHTLGQSGAHLVCWGSPHEDLDWIRSDNHGGARMATEHLLDSGYRDIVCIASETSAQRQFWERYEGYAECMVANGLKPRLARFEEGHTREEQGRRAAVQLIRSGEPFDAIFACCDEMALGALNVLREQGIAVPEQVGLVGFDGIKAGMHSAPPLSSVEPDFQAAGEMLVDRLLSVIADKPNEKQRVPVRLLPRGSSRR
ncbi:substrate-binding domain-containing protein [Novosphingobium sp. FSY-8]|uniref:Substrate-binding domain-containing protein n=1 Tax=Novosphingobium ovatum TaxID=1908523 RepID=A0ABW9XAR2_9SPHN|nr:substrate-binding domain-containing protein [Novosphingobium ovatum]NBC35597.1 substrate-binding domain-containing protein [Novosphingobium ovatum]